MNRVNWYCLIGTALYQTDSFSGFPRAFFEHVLNKLVAFRSVFNRNSNDCTGHLSLALGTAYILFSLGFSDASMPPCQFFCFVSCESFTYSSPFSSVSMTKESIFSCWWNSRPLETNRMARRNHTRKRRTTGLTSP